MNEISEEELIHEIERLKEKEGCPPTLQDLRNHGEYAAMTYYNRFGSWQDALAAAGYEPHKPESKIPSEELINELKSVADELGEPPSAEQMNEQSKYWVSTYRRRFGSWREAIAAAELEPPPEPEPIPQDELLAEIQRLASKKGEPPTYQDMNKDGKYGASTYERRFGSWTAAVETALDDKENL